VFSKVLIANRGEIAIRVARTLREMGIGSVAVYSEIDRDAPHVREADEAFLIGPAIPAESYLSIEKIIATAQEAGAEAIHPGYGFLAENADFARACGEAGIVFIGPPAEAIEEMGSKTRAREIMAAAGVPIVPGATEPAVDVEAARKQAEEAGYPVACKAAGGGGGKGFRVAQTPDDLEEAFEGAGREGEKFFSDDRVYVERYLEDPRHVEVQVLADSHGAVIHLGERDCSIQRRHQKVIEEAPGPQVDAEMRARIGKIATDAAAAVGYRGAGTVEGMQVGDEYFFLEMNTRVQVEHCVTEMVSGIDIVREQVLVAAGEALSISQEDVDLRGHAIECRINAEAAHKKFAPAPGAITTYREPAGPGVRVDSGVEAGSEVTPMYDPMVAKLIVWDVDREHATRRMLRALGEYEVGGLTTLIPFHKAILATDQWARGETCRDLMEDTEWLKSTAPETAPEPAGEEDSPLLSRDYKVEVSGKLFDVKVIGEAPAGGAAPATGGQRPPKRERKGGGGAAASSESLPSPLQGTVLKVAVAEGAEVAEGDLICVIEAMKMENEITAHRGGKVTSLSVTEGVAVNSGDVIAVIE
jgi:acetyl-CoA/propionyl-CoA carboxylase, biotin carboxylase, biotin carboxyl carrier protein